MADRAINTYLNDHLAGAMFGSDLAEHLRTSSHGSALGEVMKSLAPQIEEDRQTLIDLMDRLGSARNPVKQATTWLAEKAGRGKFSDDPLGTFMALEALSLGVAGKLALWEVLRASVRRYPALDAVELEGLIERAQAQRQTLERERMQAATRALAAQD